MKKAPHEAGPKAISNNSTTQYKRSLPVLQISPAALASINHLARLRFDYDCASVQARLNGRRAHFARMATIDAFEWRYAKALDQADFVDRPPRDRARRAWATVVGAS